MVFKYHYEKKEIILSNIMKYKIGYLDEESQWVDKFKRRLKDAFEIFTFQLTADTSISDIISQIEQEELDCLVADFELKEADIVQFNGDEVIDVLRNKYPYFPVFIITAKEEDDVLGQVEDNDIVRMKEELDTKTETLIQRIQNKISNYHNKIVEAESTIEQLIQKKNSHGLSIPEEELLTEKYLFLDKVNPEEKVLPANLIQPNSITKLNQFTDQAKYILDELKKLNG